MIKNKIDQEKLSERAQIIIFKLLKNRFTAPDQLEIRY